jgi:hypothetical protein
LPWQPHTPWLSERRASVAAAAGSPAGRGTELAHMVTADDVRACAIALPRTEEHLIRDSVRFRIGRIVYLALSPDETVMAFAFPREERAALIAAEPEKFFMPRPSDERYNWVRARMSELTVEEMRELIVDAWRMCVPKKVAAAHLGG